MSANYVDLSKKGSGNILCLDCLCTLKKRRRRNSGQLRLSTPKNFRRTTYPRRQICKTCEIKYKDVVEEDSKCGSAPSSPDQLEDCGSSSAESSLSNGHGNSQDSCAESSPLSTPDNPEEGSSDSGCDLDFQTPKNTLHPKYKSTPGVNGADSITLIKSCHRPGGIANLGNTCYIASTMQLLFHCKAFVEWLENDKNHRESAKDKCLICMLWELNQAHRKGEVIDIANFVNILKGSIPYVADGHQHDAHEFLTQFLEELDSTFLSRYDAAKAQGFPIPDAPLSEIFGFEYQGRSRCSEGHVSTTQTLHATQLQLPVRRNIYDSLKSYFMEEGVSGVECSDCNKRVDKLKAYTIVSYPKNLIVQLNRFSGLGTKNKSHIEIQERVMFNHNQYELASVIFHHGQSTKEGHYISAGATELNGKTRWHTFDDSQVNPIFHSNLKKAKYVSGAYLLLYSLKPQQSPKHYTTTGSKIKDPASAIRQGRATTSQFQDAMYRAYNRTIEFQLAPPGVTPIDFVASLFGVSTKTVRNYVGKGDRGSPFKTPGKKRSKPAPVRGVDEFVKCCIRNLIYDFKRDKRSFSVKTLLKAIQVRKIEFHGGVETLRKVLHDMGFTHKKKNRRRYLMELPEIVRQRIKFVREYMRLKSLGKYDFKFLDETWIFRYGSFTGSEWILEGDKRTYSVATTNSGQRYIILHCGGRDGWVPGASLMFQSQSNDGDYHGEMDGDVFESWCRRQLAPNIEADTIIVLDNASYHKRKSNHPKHDWRKQEFLDWLIERGENVDGKWKLDNLKNLAFRIAGEGKLNVDKVFEDSECEHDVRFLWLPPYHCHFNPIELVWARVKKYFEDNVGRCQGSQDAVYKLWDEALEQITPDLWENCVEHAEKLIQKCFETECRVLPDCTNYSQFHIALSEEDFGIEDDDSDEDDNTPISEASKRSLPFPQNVAHDNKRSKKSLPFSGNRKEAQDESGVHILSDDEEDILTLVQSMQDALRTIWDECSSLADTSTLHGTYHDHQYSSDPVRYVSLARQMRSALHVDKLLDTAGSVKLRSGDINLILDSQWLNDNVVDAFMHLLMERSKEMKMRSKFPSIFIYNCHFYKKLLQSSYQGVHKWTKNVNIFNSDLIGVPINVGNYHWCLAVLDMRHKSLKIYDSWSQSASGEVCESLRRHHTKAFKMLKSYFSQECLKKRGHKCPIESWESVNANTPQQGNTIDCGVFVCRVMECLARNDSLTSLDPKHSPFFRTLLAYEILKKKLFPWPAVEDNTPNDLLNWPKVTISIEKKPRKRQCEKQFTSSNPKTSKGPIPVQTSNFDPPAPIRTIFSLFN